MSKTRYLLLLLAGGLAACKVGPDFHPMPAPKASAYTALPLPTVTVISAGNLNAGKSQRFVLNRDLEGDWWHLFHSRALSRLVAEGINNNQQLTEAKAALREASYSLYAETGSLLYPRIDFSGQAARLQTSSLAFGAPAGPQGIIFNVYNASFQSNYLLDIWGGERREIEVYAANTEYYRYQMLATYLTLSTNIVTTAVTIASLNAQLAVTNHLIDTQAEITAITKKQRGVGAVNDQRVLSEEARLAQIKASLPPLEKAMSAEYHTLAVLLGRESETSRPTLQALDDWVLPSVLPVTLPSRLVIQRPDIQAAETQLHAASAQIGVVTSYFFPQISLTANYGYIASTTNNFFSSNNAVWGLASNVTQPIFHGAQIWMQRKAAIAAFEAKKARYRQTVLQAFKNVSDALRAVAYDARSYREQRAAEENAYQMYLLIQKQHAVGGQNYLAVLNSKLQYLQSQLVCIKAQAMRYTDTAALYQALGGGWWHQSIAHYFMPTSRKTTR